MSLHPITLETDKSITSIISEPEVLGQSEKGQVLEVSVLNSSQEPYDLSAENLSITFGENKAGGRVILDKGTANDADSGHFEITDAKNGKFNYTLCSACYEASGNAWFEIYIGDKFVDSTERFRIEVQESQRINMQNNNYVSDMAAVEDHFNASLDKYADSLKDLTTVTDNAKNQAQAEIDQIKTQITNYSKQFADITSEWTTQKQKIQDEADAQVASLKNADKDALDSAIKNINTQRDAALDQANKSFTQKLADLQSDYDNWKTKTIADFQAMVDPIKKQITENGSKLDEANTKMDSFSKELQKAENEFNSVDFTKFAKLTDLANYYTKADTYNRTELDQKIDNAGKVKTVDGNSPDSNGNVVSKAVIYCDSPQAAYDASTKDKFHLYAYDMNNEATEGYVAGQRVTIETLHNDIQTLQSQMSSKANTSDLANLGKVKTVNGNSPDSNGNVNVPAPDLSGYATKSDLATAGKMKTISVNGGAKVAPDASGNANITVATVDISGKANQSDLNNTNNRVTAIETGYMKKPTVISKADYDKLATKDPNTLYEITE